MNERKPLISLRKARTLYDFRPIRRPRFADVGQCEWCGQALSGKQTSFCTDKCRRMFTNLTVWKSRGGYAQHILRRDGFACQDCGDFHALENRHGIYVPSSDGELDIHHILPISEGGTDCPENLVTLCKECHRTRHRALWATETSYEL